MDFPAMPSTAPPFQAQEWLARYAAEGDEAAFAALVRAQSPLVWRTAMRRLGDAQLAEEAVQNVFLALARKAERLASRPGLSAWLHRAAVLEASALARSRARRERLNNAPDFPIVGMRAPAPVPADSAVGLLLDEALSRLSELDRAVLLGRYFEERSYEELGGVLGKTGAAVKKRTHRALEKIAAHLRRRGMGLSAGATASLAAADFSRAALSTFPSSAAAAVREAGGGLAGAAAGPSAAASLSGAAAALRVLTCGQRLIFLMSTTKATLTTAALLLLLLGVSGWQSGINAANRQEILERRAALQKPSEAARSRAGTGSGADRAGPLPEQPLPEQPLPDPIDGMTLVRLYAYSRAGEALLVEPPPPNWLKAMEAFYKNASKEDILRLIQEASRAPVAQSLRLKIMQDLIIYRLPDHDPALAVRMAARHGVSGQYLSQLVGKLAEKDLSAAEQLLEEFSDPGVCRGHVQSLMAGLGAYFVSKSAPADWRELPPALIGFADRHLSSGLISALIFGGDGDPQGSPAVNALTFNPGSALDLAGRVTDPADQKRLFTGLAQFHLMMQPNRITPNEAGPYFENGELRVPTNPGPEHPDRTFAIIPNVLEDSRFPAELRNSALQTGAGYMAALSGPWAALDAVRRLSPPESCAENLAVVAEKLASIPNRKAELDKLPEAASAEGQRILNQTLAETAVALTARRNSDLARTLAEKINNLRLRSETLRSAAP